MLNQPMEPTPVQPGVDFRLARGAAQGHVVQLSSPTMKGEPENRPVAAPYKDLVRSIMSKAGSLVPEKEERSIPENVVALHRRDFDSIRSKLGNSIPEIFSHGDVAGWETVHSALSTFVSWKSWNGIPLTFVEGMVAGYTGIHCEVNNGGFHQYFFNSSGDHWRNVLQILIDSGELDAERRFRNVLSIFPNGEADDSRARRWEQLERMEEVDETGMWEHFEKASRDFYDCPYPSEAAFWAAIRGRQDDFKPVWI